MEFLFHCSCGHNEARTVKGWVSKMPCLKRRVKAKGLSACSLIIAREHFAQCHGGSYDYEFLAVPDKRYLYHCVRCNHKSLEPNLSAARNKARVHWDTCHRKEFARDAVKKKDYEFFPKSERSYQRLKSIPQKEFNKALL